MRRHTEQWIAAVFAADTPARVRDAAYGMTQYADWETGLNCWASAATIAERVHRGRRTIQRGLDELEELGFIERTGVKRPQNCTDFALVIPATSSAKVGATSSAKVGATDLSQLRQSGQPVAPNQTVSSANVGAQPPLTSSDRREEDEEEESAIAPPPDGGALCAPGVGGDSSVGYLDAVKAIEKQLRAQWPKQIGIKIAGESRTLLRQLIAAGWTLDQLLTLVADMGQPRSHPAGLIRKHLAQALDYDPMDYEPVAHDLEEEPADDVTQVGPTCKHGTPVDLVDLDTGQGCQHCQRIGFRVLAERPALKIAKNPIPDAWQKWMYHTLKLGYDDRNELESDVIGLLDQLDRLRYVTPRCFERRAEIQIELDDWLFMWRVLKGGASQILVRSAPGNIGAPPNYYDETKTQYRTSYTDSGERWFETESGLVTIAEFVEVVQAYVDEITMAS